MVSFLAFSPALFVDFHLLIPSLPLLPLWKYPAIKYINYIQAKLHEMDSEKERKDLRALQSDNDSELQTDTSIDIAVPSTKPQDVEPTVDTTPHHMNYPDGGWRAWSVAYGASGVLFCTFGYANTFGVFQEYYAVHQLSDQTPSAISWIGSLQIFFLFSGNLFGGPLFDRYGAKVCPLFTLVYSATLFPCRLSVQNIG